MSLRNVSVLYHDVFGTVVDWQSSISDACRATLRAHPCRSPLDQQQLLDDYDWDEFTRHWRRGYMVTTRQLSHTGNPHGITVDQIHLDTLDRLIHRLPPPPPSSSRPPSLDADRLASLSLALADAWDATTRQHLNQRWHTLTPWPDSVHALRRLAAHFAIGTLTNGNLALMVDMARSARLPWHFILTADTLGSFKPDDRMYTSALRLMHLDQTPQRGALVAAHLFDLEAAKRNRMTTIFVSGRPTEDSLPHDGTVPDYIDIVVRDLDELARLAQDTLAP
ncbi:uncharacterized protein PFL1_01899 [Pseudozyma flocculosa PF-1]|uniref:uncharacterized protein n=1 Tax=Pseudozyma flocculosa PF-1 TaxID=1277687 RepID=UPI00045611F2|nr:uncharacterized protein PFL1_01899 [Pseudozyma flocculosa PF-1]EPQ30373.1 hypothetical protein PFL1_01899 [Pseudozyma flocculosa PF-1]